MNSEKLVLFKKDKLEVVVDKNTGETFASISATARMCNVTEGAIRKLIKTSYLNPIKKARIQTGQGLRSSDLLTEKDILKCLIKYNAELILAFAQLGLRKFFHHEIGYNHTEKKSLYPDRTEEYKDLYQQLKDLIKETNGGKHHYIQLNQTLNKVAGKIEGRTNNTISEVENYAYVLLMKKAINAGRTFIDSDLSNKNYLTREAINKRILQFEPQIKSILTNLSLLE